MFMVPGRPGAEYISNHRTDTRPGVPDGPRSFSQAPRRISPNMPYLGLRGMPLVAAITVAAGESLMQTFAIIIRIAGTRAFQAWDGSSSG